MHASVGEFSRLICCCAHLQCIRYSLIMLKCQNLILLICQAQYRCFAQQSPQLIHDVVWSFVVYSGLRRIHDTVSSTL